MTFPDLLILLLLILAVAPTFTRERRKWDDADPILLQARQMASALFQMRRWRDVCVDTNDSVRPVKPAGILGFCVL